ncbi:cytochrome c oxidase-assembly factor COX16 [Cryptococcus neoformans Bt120]|nr:cytochrome c oxidase-assembly factor COX16 [Cryptococcus neoformans var. grubii Bt120]
MPPFAARPLSSPKSHPIFAQIRRHPFILFGLPFVGIIIGSSFALQAFTQTRYDYQETKVKSVGKEEELGMKSGRRKIDLKEEYYRLNNPTGDNSSLDNSLAMPSPLSSPSSLDASLASSPAPPKKKKKFSMASISQNDYEPVRVPRPEGVPEWGGGRSGEEAPMKGYRKEDRWV